MQMEYDAVSSFYSTSQKTVAHGPIALYVILSRDMPLLKSNFFLRSEFLFGLSVGIFRAAEESNPRRYAWRQELMGP